MSNLSKFFILIGTILLLAIFAVEYHPINNIMDIIFNIVAFSVVSTALCTEK